jgi:hypothetical protein
LKNKPNKANKVKAVRKTVKVEKPKTDYERYSTLPAKFSKMERLPFAAVLHAVATQYTLFAKELVATTETKAASMYIRAASLLFKAGKASGKETTNDLSESQKSRLFWLTAATEETFFHDVLIPKAKKEYKKILPLLKRAADLVFKPF